MHALPTERVEIDRGGGDQRLALAGAHLRDRSLVEDKAADQLDVEVALFQRSFCCFPDSGKGGRRQVVESSSGGKLGPKFVGLPAQFVIAQRLKLGLERVDLGDHRPIALEPTVVGRAEDPLHHGVELKRAEHFRPFQCLPPVVWLPLQGFLSAGDDGDNKKREKRPKRPFFAPLNWVAGGDRSRAIPCQ